MDWIICWDHCSHYLYLGKYYFWIYKYELEISVRCFFHFNGSNEHIIIQNVRLPRALIAASVGASLAIAGCLMQTLTEESTCFSRFYWIKFRCCFLHRCSNCYFFRDVIISLHVDCLFRGSSCSCTCICF